MNKAVIDSDEALEMFLKIEQKGVEKRVKWAERRSRIEAVIWCLLFIASIVCACLNISDVSFGLNMIGFLVLALLTSEQGFLSGYATGRYDMSITNLRVSLRKDKKND